MQALLKRIVLVDLLVSAVVGVAPPEARASGVMSFRPCNVRTSSCELLPNLLSDTTSLRGGDLADKARNTIQNDMLSADNLAAFYGGKCKELVLPQTCA